MSDQSPENDQPRWISDDPQNWGTYWASYYQIAGAQPVLVDEYGHTERGAISAAEAALTDALGKVSALGLSVEAACWTVKHRSRRQTQRFSPTNVKACVTAGWHGRITRIDKDIYEREIAEGKRGRTAVAMSTWPGQTD